MNDIERIVYFLENENKMIEAWGEFGGIGDPGDEFAAGWGARQDEVDSLVGVHSYEEGAHPGTVFFNEFVEEKEITSRTKIGKIIGIEWNYLKKVALGEKRITPKLAMKMAIYSGVSSKVWLEMQYKFDLSELNSMH